MPAAAHQLGCRQEDLGGGCCQCPTAQLPFPALVDLVVCTLISRTIQPFRGASTAVCLGLQDSHGEEGCG